MTLRFYLDGVELDADRVYLSDEDPLTEAAAHGEVGSAGIKIEDPDGDLTFNGFSEFYVEEDAASPVRLWTGYIGVRSISRGSYTSGAGRVYDCTLADLNLLLTLRIIRGEAGKRPFETLAERVTWLLGSGFVSGVIDNGLVDTLPEINYDERDYRGQRPIDVLQEIAPVAGKTFYTYHGSAESVAITSSSVASPTVITTAAVHRLTTGDSVTIAGHSGSTPDINGTHTVTVTSTTTFTIAVNVTTGGTGGTVTDNAAAGPSLFLDQPAAEVNDSSLRIANTAGDIDATGTSGTTFPAFHESVVLTRSAEEVYTGVLYTYKSGELYTTRQASIDEYGIERDGAVTVDRVGRLETAQSEAARYLEQQSVEADELRLTVRLPKAKVNLIRAGMRIQVQMSHLPGYATFQWLRITRRTVRRTRGFEFYDLDLELSNRTPPAAGGGSPGNFPLQPAGPPSLEQHKTGSAANILTLDAAPTPGHLLLALVSDRDGGGDITVEVAGWTKVARATNTTGFVRDAHAYVRVADGINPNDPDGIGEPSHDGFFVADGPIGSLTTTLMEWAGSYPAIFDTQDSVGATTDLNCGGAVTPTAGKPSVVVGIGAIGSSDADYPGTTVAPDSGVTELADTSADGGNDSPGHWTGYLPVTSPSGASTVGGTISASLSYCGITVVVEGEGGSPPLAGQWVFNEVVNETPDGATTVFTVDHAFAAGSLSVTVDDLPQTAAITSQDGPTKTFTLGFAPKTGEVVKASYQGI